MAESVCGHENHPREVPSSKEAKVVSRVEWDGAGKLTKHLVRLSDVSSQALPRPSSEKQESTA